MRIHFYGHSAFLLESAAGLRVIIDPYTAQGFGGRLAYDPIHERAGLVLVSHEHVDHYDAKAVTGEHETLTAAGAYQWNAVSLLGVHSAHDENGGARRGSNIIWCATIDQIKCVHCGDLGERLSGAQASAIGPVDVLMVPVGGNFTIGVVGARRVMDQLSPRIVIPMHYKTPKVDFPIAPVDEFLVGPDPVVRIGGPTLLVNESDLPSTRTIYVLEPSR